ncbi:MAG: hypothetical protein H0U54_15165, partial [Acidobacteria bacterium]|nr:hypothetical protein [Acidobacteriota bacterium]
EQFKSYYLASPLRREKVKLAQAFHLFAEKNAAAQTAEALPEKHVESATKRNGSGWFSRLEAFSTRRLVWQWGMAFAVLALLIAGSWLVFENRRGRQQMSQKEPRRDVPVQRAAEQQKEIERQNATNLAIEKERERMLAEQERLEQQRAAGQRQQQPSPPTRAGVATFIVTTPLTAQMRGVGQLATISIPAKTDAVAMQLELEPNDFSAYRVSLLNQSGAQTLWRSGKLKARAAGDSQTLSITFRADLLKPQIYVVRVSGVPTNGASEILGDYSFRVVK